MSLGNIIIARAARDKMFFFISYLVFFFLFFGNDSLSLAMNEFLYCKRLSHSQSVSNLDLVARIKLVHLVEVLDADSVSL